MTDEKALLMALAPGSRRWVVLTGAGVSAASGIPTYRDASGKWLGSQPIQHREFVSDIARRRRYWGRSMLGWPGVRDAEPNALHRCLAAWEATGAVELLITQNVDRLHQRGGSQAVIDLHGRLDRVRCLDCGAGYEREEIQEKLVRRNPDHPRIAGSIRPDGDVDVALASLRELQLVDCDACGGMLMPDVVFFGGSVPKARVAACEAAIEAADGVLVVGSSLQVFSGYRFARMAHQQDKPLVIVNEGSTRADDIATLKINDNALATLTALLTSISDRSPQLAKG